MPIHIKNKNKGPPGGYFIWKDNKTGAVIRKPSYRRLLTAVWVYAKSNELEPPSEASIEANICENQPEICWNDERPSIVTQAKNLLNDGLEWARRGMPIVSKEVLDARLRTCNGCEHWGGYKGGTLIEGRCGKCGCSGAKLALGTSKCPVGKW